MDENLNSVIETERLKIGQKGYYWTEFFHLKLDNLNIYWIVIEINDLVLSREFSKQGCTKSLRGNLWSQMLNVNLDPLVI